MAFTVFTNDIQKGFGFLFLSIIISTTSQLLNHLSRGYTESLTFANVI
ncbi:hypothetical protein HOF65_02380 [bacterium]|nr:hypothetical protein [bacterium]